MIMRLYLLVFVSVLTSCQKIWVEDLQERAYDTIRGKYEMQSAVWEGPEPIDINGDGTASFSFLDEWSSIHTGAPLCHANVDNEGGTLEIPYTIDERDERDHLLGRSPKLARRSEYFSFSLKAVIDGKDESHLEFDLPEGEYEFCHSGYGEITFRTVISFAVKVDEVVSEEIEGPVLIRYVRTEYRGE